MTYWMADLAIDDPTTNEVCPQAKAEALAKFDSQLIICGSKKTIKEGSLKNRNTVNKFSINKQHLHVLRTQNKKRFCLG